MYIISYLVYHTQQVAGVNRSWLVRKSVSPRNLVLQNVQMCLSIEKPATISFVGTWHFGIFEKSIFFSTQSFKIFKRCKYFQQLCRLQGHNSYIFADSHESSCSLIFEECCPFFKKIVPSYSNKTFIQRISSVTSK